VTREEIIPPDPSLIVRPPGVAADRAVARLMRDEDVPQIVELLKLCFDRWPPFEVTCSLEDHVRWKMHADDESRARQTVATPIDDDATIISSAFQIRRLCWVRGEEKVSADAADQAVHPDWRQLGVNEKRHSLRRELGVENHDFLLSWLPNHPATRRAGLRNPILGNRVIVLWQPGRLRSVASVPYRVRGRAFAARVVRDWLRHQLSRPFRRSRVPAFDGEIVDLKRFDDRTDAVWEAAKTEFDFAAVRRQGFLNWRFADPRAGRFVMRAAIEDGEVIGYCVTKPYANPAEIMDLLVLPGRLDAVAALVSDAVRLIREQGRAEIHCWLPQTHPYLETVRALGFFDSGRDPSLRYSPAVMGEEELAFLRDPGTRVHATIGDTDFS
jgi:GNAT superfamily N-acetyltransferase